MTPRGIKNNNPLNIEYHNRNNWHGQLPYNKIIEPRFCRFSDMMWGYRAAAIMLKKYINEYGCNTVTKIIGRWAPAAEKANNTNAYVQTVAKMSNVGIDQKISFDDQLVMLGIMSAMTVVECGVLWNPQHNSALWDALYKGYKMVREHKTNFSSVEDAK